MKGKHIQKKPLSPLCKDILFLLSKIAILAVFLIILFCGVFGIYRCGDQTMSPACKESDLVIVYRLQNDFHPSDVIVLEKNGERQIRRVVAVAGDVVDITADGLVVNGNIQQETDIFKETLPYREGITLPVTVPEAEYFVLGDNRLESVDSRIYGSVSQDEIKGIVITLLRRRGI